MPEEIKKNKKLSFYLVTMFLVVIIVILIAAMADHREEDITQKINEQQKVYETLSGDIVALEGEKHRLESELETALSEKEAAEEAMSFYQSLNNARALCSAGNRGQAAEVIAWINPENLSEKMLSEYNEVKQLTDK